MVDISAALQAWMLELDSFSIDMVPRFADRPVPSQVLSVMSTHSAESMRSSEAQQGAPFAEAPVDRAAALQCIAQEIAACKACDLAAGRTRVVPGQGSAHARMLFVGEAPGAEEDRTGDAFVGEAGQLLTRMIGAMGLQREQVFITNVVKCRPPENRDPLEHEAAACRAFLLRQLASVNPEVVVALGAHATRSLLQHDGPLSAMRGRVHDVGRMKVVATYHPSYLIRMPSMKRAAWEDLKLALSLLKPAAKPTA